MKFLSSMKNEITINDKLKKLKDNGVIIFPKFNIKHKFAVTIEDNNNFIFKNKITIGEYKHTTKTINDALYEAVNYCYSKTHKRFVD